MSNNPFSISQIEVKNQTDTNGSVFVFAVNLQSQSGFEWGSICNNGTISVPNYPILQQPYPGLSYLQISTFNCQYQLMWVINGDDPNTAAIEIQYFNGTNQYPNNIVVLQTLPVNQPAQFKLVVDLAAPAPGNVSLVQLQ